MFHRLGLLFLTLTVANICVVQLVNGNVNLVEKVCDGTPAPEACLQCLLNSLGDEDAEKDLAFRTLECSQRMITTVDGDLFSIAEGSDDFGVKGRCASCRKSIKVVGSQSLENAASFLKDDNFPDAAKQVATAIDEWDGCYKLVSDLLDPPPTFLEHFNYLKDLYLVAQDIVMKL